MTPAAMGARVAVLWAAGACALSQPAAAAPPQEAEKSHQAEAGADRVVLWKLANFLLLAGALGYLIYRKGGPFFAARSQEIRRSLEEAARLKREAEARYAEIEQRLAHVAVEIENLRSQAREESTAEAERVRRQIELDLKKIQVQAEQEISAAGKAARQELLAYSAELAVRLAADRLRERLSPEADNALVASVVAELEQRFAGQVVRAS